MVRSSTAPFCVFVFGICFVAVAATPKREIFRVHRASSLLFRAMSQRVLSSSV